MGQVVTFPAKRSEAAVAERSAAILTWLCGLTYLLGFFIAGPMLALYTYGFATTSHPGAAVTCVAGLAVVWVLTRAAYKRI